MDAKVARSKRKELVRRIDSLRMGMDYVSDLWDELIDAGEDRPVSAAYPSALPTFDELSALVNGWADEYSRIVEDEKRSASACRGE